LAGRLGPSPSATAWFRFAELDRTVGDLAAAARHYAACLYRQPDHRWAQALADILAGRPEPGQWAAGESQPCPYLCLEGLLPAEAQAVLWTGLAAKRGEFAPAGVYEEHGPGHLDSSARRALRMAAGQALEALFVPRLRAIVAEHDLIRRFGLPKVDLTQAEVEIASSGEGAFFLPHRDNGGKHVRRTLTFVYYFHRKPQLFHGGDLLLRDDLEGQPQLAYTRFSPMHNRLILFPSNRYHQVLTVRCASNDPLDSRLTVHGWFPAL
jgi:hypothetical protein